MKFKPKKKEKNLRKLLDPSTPTLFHTGAESETITMGNDTVGISGASGQESGIEVQDPVMGYWKPSLDLSLVLDMQSFPRNHVPMQIAKVREEPSSLDHCYCI